MTTHTMKTYNNETVIENKIRTRMERVIPSRALFEETLQHVTKEQSKRSTYMKALPSPYQFFLSRITARSTKIGVSVALVALIAVLAIKTGDYGAITHIDHQLPQETPSGSVETPQSDDVSADQIVAMLTDDANAEVALGASEEDDGTTLTQDLEEYTII